MNREELINFTDKNFDIGEDRTVLKKDCENIIFLFDNCEIDFPEERRFFCQVNCEGIQLGIALRRAMKFDCELTENGLSDGEEALAYTGAVDFSHTNSEWESIVRLGIYGLRERITEYSAKYAGDIKRQEFYSEVLRVYDAALRFINRAADKAKAMGKEKIARGLYNLSKGSPSNLYEAMQTAIIYYTLQCAFDGTYLRTMGRLDTLYYDFYKREDADTAKQLVYDFIKEIDAFKFQNNIPFAICGTGIDGNDITNELSYLLLDTYKTAGTVYTKLHILCSDNTPKDIVKSGLEAVRSGNNSIVFMSDKKIIESLEKLGIAHEDAVNYHIVGCYECGGEGEITCSCSSRVNLPKALEYAVNNGTDMLTGKRAGLEPEGSIESFDDLYKEFLRQTEYLCKCAMKATDLYEMHYGKIHASPVMSAAYASALEKGGDLYCDYTAKYNNSSVNALGLGTVVDSLAAIRKLVFEDKTVSLSGLADILKSNWEGYEQLRLTAKNKFPKFGTGERQTDELAKDIVDKLSSAVSGKPNAKGGVYRLGLFSIDWRWDFGKKTAASADGRLCGETISQNTSASFGAAAEGATAHLLSVAALDASNTPNGAIVDIDLHSSAVKGENGLDAMYAALKSYFELGGFAVQYNVLDTEVLRNAKIHPDMYPDLQVRLCGWNVLFNTLSDKEKDEFIARSAEA